jgi:dGTPase
MAGGVVIGEAEFEEEIKRAIHAAHDRGARELHDILPFCEGADPRVVARVLGELGHEERSVSAGVARQGTSELSALFPAADPICCQWWFTVDTIERLATRMAQYSGGPNDLVAFVGTPTVAFQYSRRYGGATLFEVDPHVLNVMKASPRLTPVAYDVSADVPEGHAGRFAAALLDPPWYPEFVGTFIARGLELARPGASVLCSLPPRLTRPGIVEERQELVRTILEWDVELVSIEPSATRYLVPEFERRALGDLQGFDGTAWRVGDLLHVRKRATSKFFAAGVSTYSIRPYARRPREFRFFFRADSEANADSPDWLLLNREFERTTSRRNVHPASLQWWTSSKAGGTSRNPVLTEQAVQEWASGRSETQTVELLCKNGVAAGDAHSLCRELDAKLELWSRYGQPTVRLGTSDVATGKRTALAVVSATKRPYEKQSEDGYRGPFQRDRDRVVWSRGFRQLANKTQVFPVSSQDFLRNRMSHSLEVMQLAATIAASFGLNIDLVEAGALAHDIGHTPFGHAGEDAMDTLFEEIKGGLGGFNHYEHGVDVVRWLEDAYQSPAVGGLAGLNLTSDVAECIFKHTYCQNRDRFSQDEIYKRSKHKNYFSNALCNLEGQAVRVADKVSYLISDLEDGIRMGVFALEDLVRCKLLRRPPIDLSPRKDESLHERFLSQRPLVVGLLMEDIIDSTDRRLATRKTIDAVQSAEDYTVNHSSEIAEEVDEIWNTLQAKKLHRDARVRLANLHAGRIVRELTLLLSIAPELVDPQFVASHRRIHQSEYMDYYRNATGKTVKVSPSLLRFIGTNGQVFGQIGGQDPEIPIEHLVQAKDFVAGLSDARARELHAHFTTLVD